MQKYIFLCPLFRELLDYLLFDVLSTEHGRNYRRSFTEKTVLYSLAAFKLNLSDNLLCNYMFYHLFYLIIFGKHHVDTRWMFDPEPTRKVSVPQLLPR